MLLPLFANAQTGSLTIFSEQGDPFYLYLNGNKMNDSAVTKIRLEGLSGEYYTVKVDFKSASIAPITKRLGLIDGNDKLSDATYRIRKDKSGKARFSFYAMQSAESGFVPANDVKVIRFYQDTVDVANQESAPVSNSEAPKKESTLLTNVKGATVSTPKKSENSKVKTDSTVVQKPVAVEKKEEVKAVVKEEVKKDKKELKNIDSVRTSVKTEIPKAEPKKKEVVKSESNVGEKKEAPKKETTKQPVSKNKYPSKKCNDWPMMKTEFVKAKSEVEAAKNDQQRLRKAKEMAEANCLLVSQVSEVSNLLVDEKVKLEFLKYSFGFIIDRNNYSRLEKVLTSAELIKDFKAFHQERTSE